MRAFRLPFSLLLPALDLVLWVILALVPITLGYFGYLADAREDHRFHPTVAAQPLPVAPEEIAREQLEVAMEGRGLLVTGLDLPGMVGEVLVSLPTSWPESWHPEGLDLFTWRALSFPVFALPAWWFAGVSLDALFRRRRVHWAPAVAALGLSGFCAVMTSLLPLNRVPGEPAMQLDLWLGAGAAFWTVLFGVAPVAWWRQRRGRAVEADRLTAS